MTKHLYLHVPFCATKCHYCSFYSLPATADRCIAYATLPAAELSALRHHTQLTISAPHTLYIGGGTPATLGSVNFSRMVATLKRTLDLTQLQEWSVELNPANTDAAFLTVLRNLGVTRLSFGAQSFNDEILKNIGRRHTAAQTRAIIKTAQALGFTNIGIDLIAGLPRVTPSMWQATLAELPHLGLQHISIYTLLLEPHTPLAQAVAAGLAVPDDDTQLNDMLTATRMLADWGLERYEISNFALPGFECRHNLGVWRGEDYLGLGPAAASRIQHGRWHNTADLAAYSRALSSKRLPPRQFNTLTAPEDLSERLTFALRLREGLALDSTNPLLTHPDGQELITKWDPILRNLQPHGIIRHHAGRWQLTARGYEVCDAVLRELM